MTEQDNHDKIQEIVRKLDAETRKLKIGILSEIMLLSIGITGIVLVTVAITKLFP